MSSKKYLSFHPTALSFHALESLFPGMDNYLRYMSGRVPVLRDMAKFYDSYNWMTDYMNNRNISWDDVKYPSMVGQGGSISSISSLFQPDYDSYQKLYD